MCLKNFTLKKQLFSNKENIPTAMRREFGVSDPALDAIGGKAKAAPSAVPGAVPPVLHGAMTHAIINPTSRFARSHDRFVEKVGTNKRGTFRGGSLIFAFLVVVLICLGQTCC
ncbi:LOW QUALITY PROTEIN: hypothetical protein V1478_002971 [Vespula squamosa]|uniref:Uncharacterized protein n=1 Tax=Vespula squamosa TaxID=30214 RepID=A0ABD2BRD1_VESSQ